MKGKVLLGLVASAVLTISSVSLAGNGAGKTLFESKKCTGCHAMERTAKNSTIDEQLSSKGPDLWYAGSKFKKDFLFEWLAAPRPIRPMEFNSLTKKNSGKHPMLDKKEAAEVTEYLMGLKSPDVKSSGIHPNQSLKGNFIFQKKLGCYGCHEYKQGAKTVGGLTGPSLVGVSKRLQPDWVYAYLSNPRAFTPVPDMPVYAGIIDEGELKTLAEYVAGLN